MRRYFLKVGDKSTAGGLVLEGESTTMHHGTPLTSLGALVFCHACKSQGRLVGQGPRRPVTIMGKQVALDGDLCLCKCTPTPLMLASQSTAFEEFESGELQRMGFQPNGTPIETTPKRDFDERVQIMDERNRPLACVPYHIRTSRGIVYKGITDASGYCPRVYTEQAESLEIALGMKALDRWEQ
ncbi:PAAR domain-containing protein [Caballeronia sp. ATUFL_M2_KS44]|uniref:PAAR domain-containing protein n=1 Tax=Caballeronia sp. ATUFL_M2_KS44 TaxID=2921767 RepID=UPI002027EA35|nr:PAAR domain-containing protein [Caballeronia sp. ATUFL_M2_KS44]